MIEETIQSPTLVNVGISEMKFTSNPDKTLITYSLGSCLGLTAYDISTGWGGLIHCMLPISRPADGISSNPAKFVDTGVTLFLNRLLERGAKKRTLTLYAAGCSQIMDPNGFFKIGERNHLILRKILWKNGLMLAGESVGGTDSRTLSLDLKTGDTHVKSRSRSFYLN